jgi:hypothetical protein
MEQAADAVGSMELRPRSATIVSDGGTSHSQLRGQFFATPDAVSTGVRSVKARATSTCTARVVPGIWVAICTGDNLARLKPGGRSVTPWLQS